MIGFCCDVIADQLIGVVVVITLQYHECTVNNGIVDCIQCYVQFCIHFVVALLKQYDLREDVA